MTQRLGPFRFGLVVSTSVWLACAVVVFGLRGLSSPARIEQVYSATVYPVARRLLDGLFGWWPLPASACFIVVGLALIARSLTREVRSPVHASAFAKTGAAALSLLRSAAVLGVSFLALWGFNYGRPDIAEDLGLAPRPLTTEQLWDELRATADYVAILRRQLPLSDTADYSSLPLPQSNEHRIRESVQRQLDQLDIPSAGRVRTRYLPAGTLLRFNTSGVYFPYTGEAHVDVGLHSLQLPFVMAHEMAHGYGVTDEGACNFVAWLACTRAHNLFLRYAGHLTYLRYVGSAVRRRDGEAYAAFRQDLPVGVRADLDSIARNLDRFEEILPEVRDAVYDGYLRSQGVHDGLASYRRIIDLVAAWRSAQRSPPAAQL